MSVNERAKTAGQIRIHQESFIEDLRNFKKNNKTAKDDSWLLVKPSNQEQVRCMSSRISTPNFLQEWLSEKSIRKVQEKTDYESASIKNMYEALLNKERDLQTDLEQIFQDETIRKNRKLHLLLKKWYERAYLPLNDRIALNMNSDVYEKVDKEKRIEFLKYLKHRNQKGHVFLDVYDQVEYDPLYFNRERPGPIKACTGKLADPLLQQQDQRNEEDRVALACIFGERLPGKEIEAMRLPPLPLVPLGRHGTECSTWQGMKFTDIQSDVRVRSQSRRLGIRNNSTNTCFEEFTSPPEELEVFTRKNKWCKRRQFPGRHDITISLV